MESVMETKLLDFNLDNSCVIVMGSPKQKSEIESKLQDNPLTLCGQEMPNVRAEKYLGDMISSAGLAESVQATFTKRKGQVVSSILEIKYVVEDCRSTVVRGIVAGIDIWKLAVLPNLLNNSETWTELHKKTVESTTTFYTYQRIHWLMKLLTHRHPWLIQAWFKNAMN